MYSTSCVATVEHRHSHSLIWRNGVDLCGWLFWTGYALNCVHGISAKLNITDQLDSYIPDGLCGALHPVCGSGLLCCWCRDVQSHGKALEKSHPTTTSSSFNPTEGDVRVSALTFQDHTAPYLSSTECRVRTRLRSLSSQHTSHWPACTSLFTLHFHRVRSRAFYLP